MGKREKKEKQKGRFGAFLGGGFLGFNLAVGLIVGIFCFAYFKVSPNWINKTFKTDINLGSDEINSKTLSQLVTNVMSLAQNADSYKLSNLKDDFGIEVKDDLFGISIKDLKDVPLSELAAAIENKFGTISAYELKNVNGMNLETEMGKILDEEIVYYFNSTDEKLYKKYENSEYSEPVAFKYSLIKNGGKVEKVVVKEHEEPVVLGEVAIPVWYLPLTVGLGDFTSNMGDLITLKELENQYGVNLPSFFDGVDKQNTTINGLENAINKLKVADFLGYTIEGDVVKDGGTVVTGVLAKLSKYTVENLEQGINDLKLVDIFGDGERTGVLALIDNPDKVTLTGETDEGNGILSISDALSKVIEEKTIDEFITAGLVDTPTGYTETTKLNWFQLKDDSYKQVKDLLLQDIVDMFFENVDIGNLPSEKPVV